jgi:hypothetical protein
MYSKQQKSASARFTLLSVLAAFVFCLTGASSVACAADPASLLAQARTSASQLSKDAGVMQAFAGNKMSWQSHANQINVIKGHVNKMGEILSQLHEARGDASQVHQRAIDRISPLLQEIASNTTAVIDHLNENQGHIWSPTYQSYVSENARLTSELSGAISNFVEYDKTKTRMDQLEQKLNTGE